MENTLESNINTRLKISQNKDTTFLSISSYPVTIFKGAVYIFDAHTDCSVYQKKKKNPEQNNAVSC